MASIRCQPYGALLEGMEALNREVYVLTEYSDLR